MNELIIYFVKNSGILLLFIGLYFFLLRKETFFMENRFFLLGGMIFSLILPFVVITRYIEITTVVSETKGVFLLTETNIAPEHTISLTTILLYIYVAGIIFFFGKFLVAFFSLVKLLWTSKVAYRDERFKYIETTSSFSPFSFFNYIVYNPKLYTASELSSILKHEQAHSSQLHSIDVFVSKLYCIFMWFNPFAWLYKGFILQNLEFLADSAAIKQTPSKKEYQLTLLKVSGNAYCPALTNNFYNSLIKKRIVMLQKTKSTQFNRWKQVLILPMLIAFAFLFNTEVIAKEIPSTVAKTETITNDKDAGDIVIVITKNTTVEELKAYKKLFSSQKIKFKFSDVDFNSKGEISSISLVLTSKNMEAANAKFETAGDKAISEIQLGKRNNELFIRSSAFKNIDKDTYTYTVTSEYINDDAKHKKMIVKKSGNGSAKVNTWIKKDDVKTIDIKKDGDKEVIIINGKEISPETIIEEEIEIKNGDGNSFIFVGSSNGSDDEEIEIEVIEEKDGKVVFRNSNNEKPLIIIDGKVADQTKMNELDSKNIDSITVLKGDVATSKYGAKAKDGVVIVKTKK